MPRKKMSNKRSEKRFSMLCFALLLCACCAFMFVRQNEPAHIAIAEEGQGASGGSAVVVQFAQSALTVSENDSFAVPILADNWGKSARDIRVRVAVSDPEIDIVNTKITSGSGTLQDMRKEGVIVDAAVNGSQYLTAAKQRTSERAFYVRSKARNTPLCMGGYYDARVTGDRVVTFTLLEPTDGETYAVGPVNTLTVIFTEVDEKRPPRTAAQTKEEWVRANLEWLREKYPTGAYWNHYVGNANDPNGITRTPCQNGKHREIGEITGRMGIGSSICNTSSHSMYIRRDQQDYVYIDQAEYSFIQCVGYAMTVARDIFGTLPYDGLGWETFSSVSSWGALEVGDYVRADGHSFFVIDAQEDLITVTECNFEDDPCAIFWDGQYLLSESGEAVSRVSQNGVARPQFIESVSRILF